MCRAVHFDGFNIALQNINGFTGCGFRVCRAVHFDGFNIALQNINGFTSCDFGCAKQYILMVLILRYKTSMVLQVVISGVPSCTF